MAEEDVTARLGGMLDVPDDATRYVFTGSTRAGTRALVAGLAAGPWDDGVGLVVAADAPRGEPESAEDHAAGAGAAAFVLADDGPASVVERAEYAAEFPGTRFRETGESNVEGLGVTSYDREAFSETLAGAVEGVDADEVDAAAVQAPDGKLPYRAAGALGVGIDEIRAGALVHELGDTGAACVPLSLAKSLAEGHERILAASFGSGAGADAFVVEAEGDVPVSIVARRRRIHLLRRIPPTARRPDFRPAERRRGLRQRAVVAADARPATPTARREVLRMRRAELPAGRRVQRL